MWIEISRNIGIVYKVWSPSARKVWIEILMERYSQYLAPVAFREEGVD